MSNSRQEAHAAMRDLWQVAEERLQASDVKEKQSRHATVREVETEGGLTIRSYAGRLSVSAEFDKADGSEETIEVDFPEDLRDMSEADVRIEWTAGRKEGTNTPPLREFGRIATQLKELM